MATLNELASLKSQWEADPSWDLFETEGFEEHREELKDYQESMQKLWQEGREAEALGLVGLHRLIKDQQKEIDQLKRTPSPHEEDNVTPLEEVKNLIQNIRQSKETLETTDLEYFSSTDLHTLIDLSEEISLIAKEIVLAKKDLKS